MGKFIRWIFGGRTDVFREIYGRTDYAVDTSTAASGTLGTQYPTAISIARDRSGEEALERWDEAEAKHA